MNYTDFELQADALSNHELDALKFAQMHGYLPFDSDRSPVFGLYWQWCAYTGRPYIAMTRYHHCADIWMDMYTVEWDLTPEAQRQISDLFYATTLEFYQSTFVGPEVAYSEMVALNLVDVTATKLYEIVTDPNIEAQYLLNMINADYIIP